MKRLFLVLLMAGGLRAENLLLITLDTTRADHLSCYGRRAATPNLDALAARGMRYLHAYTPSPSTLPAHTVIFTGLLPDKTGVRGNVYFRIPADLPWLPSAFKDKGYHTYAFISSRILDRRFGTDRGFEFFDQPEGKERPGGETVEAVMKASPGFKEPFFLWVHFFDPHDPYTPPEPYKSRASSLYAGEVEYMDAQVGALLKLLGDRLSRSWIIAAADHGEMLYEHQEPTHGYSLYQPAIHVPLIVVPPGGVVPSVPAAPVNLADIAPTVRRLFGLASIPTDGMDLLRPSPSARVFYEETFLPFYTYRWSPLRGFLQGNFKFLRGSRDQSFQIADDQEEEISRVKPDVHQRLAKKFGPRLKETGRPSDQTAVPIGLKEDLMSLGYLSSPVREIPKDFSSLPHPLDMLDLIQFLVVGIQKLMDDKRYDDVVGEIRTILKRSPDNLVAYYALAKAYFMKERYAEASQAWEYTLKFQDNDPWVLANLALCAARQKETVKAQKLFRSALGLIPDDPNILRYASDFLLEERRPEDALALFPGVLTASGRKIKAGVLDRAARIRAPKAEAWLHEAVRLDPDSIAYAKKLVALMLDRGAPEEALNVLDFSRRNCTDSTGRSDAERAYQQLKEMLSHGVR